MNNFPETPDDAKNYVRYTDTVGAWRTLEDAKEITDLQTEQTTQNNRLTTLENDEPANNNIGHLWRTQAGVSSWIQLTADGEYSTTRS